MSRKPWKPKGARRRRRYTKPVVVLVFADQHGRLRARARFLGLSLSAYLRSVALSDAPELGPKVDPLQEDLEKHLEERARRKSAEKSGGGRR